MDTQKRRWYKVGTTLQAVGCTLGFVGIFIQAQPVGSIVFVAGVVLVVIGGVVFYF